MLKLELNKIINDFPDDKQVIYYDFNSYVDDYKNALNEYVANEGDFTTSISMLRTIDFLKEIKQEFSIQTSENLEILRILEESTIKACSAAKDLM